MKRTVYIVLFSLLGIFVQLIVHFFVETGYTALLHVNYDLFTLGLSWDIWIFIHSVFSVGLIILGVIFGYRQGIYWWKRVYGTSA